MNWSPINVDAVFYIGMDPRSSREAHRRYNPALLLMKNSVGRKNAPLGRA